MSGGGAYWIVDAEMAAVDEGVLVIWAREDEDELTVCAVVDDGGGDVWVGRPPSIRVYSKRKENYGLPFTFWNRKIAYD